jgi:hypothetical protein
MPTRGQTQAQATFIAEALHIERNVSIQDLIDIHLRSDGDTWSAPSREDCLISFSVPAHLPSGSPALASQVPARSSLWLEQNGNLKIPSSQYLGLTPR